MPVLLAIRQSGWLPLAIRWLPLAIRFGASNCPAGDPMAIRWPFAGDLAGDPPAVLARGRGGLGCLGWAPMCAGRMKTRMLRIA